MMDIDSLAQALFGSPRAETQEVATDGTTRTYMGVAMSDSDGGTVVVDLGGDVTLPDDLYDSDGNVVAEWDGVGVEMSTSPQVLEGEDVIVTLVGGSATKKPMVTAVAGTGDRQNERIDVIEADYVKATELEADVADIGFLKADSAVITGIQADTAKVHNLTAQELSAATGYVSDLVTGNVTAQQLVADHATIGTLDTTYMHADMANADVAWIDNGTIRDGAIVSAMINDVSANKLTAGTINGSVINVTNLNADNITAGTINGQRIGQGSLSLDKLSESVYTEAEVDTIVDGLNGRIDGAIETHTGTAVPTLNNSPASSWNTIALKDEHIGDVYYVVNSQSQQNGYCYRFTKSGSTYSWQLIKDSDVTAALSRLTTAEGKITSIESFDSTVSSFMTNTDSELTSVKSRATSLETRMTDAEGDISEKVDTSTFNTLSQTVDGNSASITSMGTVLTNNGLTSSTNITNTVNTVSQTATGNSSKITQLTTTLGTNADGTTKAGDVVHRTSAVEQDLSGFKTTVSQTYATNTTVDGLATRVSTAESNITQNANNIALKVSESDVTGNYIVGKINLNSTTASIAAEHINLQGAVTISDLASDAQNATLNSNISIGGRNLLLWTGENDTYSDHIAVDRRWDFTGIYGTNVIGGNTVTFTKNDSGLTNNSSGIRVAAMLSDGRRATETNLASLSFGLDLKAGDVLTFSCDVKTSGNRVALHAQYFNGASRWTNAGSITEYGEPSDTDWHRYSHTFTIASNYVSLTALGIYCELTDGVTISARNFKLERGNKATDWTPAPEDTPDQMTWYGTCSTEAASAAKVVACDGFELKTGARLAVKFTVANTTNAPMLNVNGTGGIATWYNNEVSSSSNPIRWGANATLNFVYDGTVWVLDERPPSYSATCSTAATTRSKAPSVVGALVVNGTRLSVRFSTANTYAANSVQVNLSSTGAYSIYQDNAVTSTTNTLLWGANTILTFVAQGTYWHLLSRSDASKTATSYVTEITGQNGIMVHPSTDQTTGVQITSDVDILRDGTSVINIGTDDAIRIGAADNVQMLIESDGLEIDNELGNKIFGIESSSSGSTTVTAALVTWSAIASVDTTARTVSDSTTAAGEPIVTATVNGTDYTLESTHVTTTVTAGTGVTVALTSSGVSYVQDLMTEINEDSVETILPCELSVEYQRAVTDIAELSFAGRYDLSAVGRAMVLHNNQWSAANQTDIYYVAKNDVTGASVVFGVGTGGQNRGIWDEVRGNWIIHRTENNETVINGPNFSVSASGIARVTSSSNASVALRASDYRNNRGIWDYDENKWLLLKGSDKKVTVYGDAIIVSLPSGRNEYSTPAGTVIWSSASGWQMADGVTLNLPKNISTCPSGIVLHWQAYANDATQNYDHSYTFIPKQHVVASAGAGVLCNMANSSFTYVGTKYIYVHDNRLVGNANNTATGFNSSMNYANNHWVLTQVIAV